MCKRINDRIADDDDAARASAMASQLVQVAAPIQTPPVQMQTQYLPAQRHGRGVDSLQSLQNRLPQSASNRAVRFATVATDQVNHKPQRSHSNDSAITISVTAALRDRRDEATPTCHHG